MKKTMMAVLALTMLLAGCGGRAAGEATMPTTTPETSVVEAAETPPKPTPKPTATETRQLQEQDKSTSTAKTGAVVTEDKPATEPTAAPTPEPTPAPTPEPVTAVPAVENLSYGAIPFELAAQDGTWWQIDSTDSAYWAVQENINAIRAAGGLGALSMSDGLSASAGSRCKNFVAGGAFDHSGMITKSEICASGPIGSASEVCTAWQGSANHYANIMRTDISSMGVACWFCNVDGNNYTYWVVTFE